MPSAPAPFVSFNDYLDANSGSLEKERGDLTTAATGAVDKSLADTSALYGQAAYSQGAGDAQAAWSAQRNDPNQHITSSEQYKAPTGGAFNPGAVQLTSDVAKEQETAKQNVAALGAGGLGSGKGAFEAGMIGAQPGLQDTAKALQGKLDANSDLDDAAKQYQAGLSSFAPKPITSYQTTYDPATSGSGAPQEGPVQKPGHKRTKYINGKPVDGEEAP